MTTPASTFLSAYYLSVKFTNPNAQPSCLVEVSLDNGCFYFPDPSTQVYRDNHCDTYTIVQRGMPDRGVGYPTKIERLPCVRKKPDQSIIVHIQRLNPGQGGDYTIGEALTQEIEATQEVGSHVILELSITDFESNPPHKLQQNFTVTPPTAQDPRVIQVLKTQNQQQKTCTLL